MRKEGKQGTEEYAKVERELAQATKDLTNKQGFLNTAQTQAKYQSRRCKRGLCRILFPTPLVSCWTG